MKFLSLILVWLSGVLAASAGVSSYTYTLPRGGKALFQQIFRGEAHFYNLSLEAGQVLTVSAVQQSADVALALYSPQQLLLVRSNIANGNTGEERISFVAPEAGYYTLEVQLDPETHPGGCYRIRIEDLRQAESSDYLYALSLHKLLSAEELRVEGSAVALTRAAELAINTISNFHELGNRNLEARVLWNICEINYFLSRNDLSIPFCDASANLFRIMNDSRGLAESLNTTGVISVEIGNTKKGRDFYNQALDLWRSLKDEHGEALVLHNLAVSYYMEGDQDTALKHYEAAIPLWEATGDVKALGNTFSGVGLSYAARSEVHKAITNYSRALPLQRAAGDLRSEASTLNNLAMLFVDLGELQKALDALNQALDIRKVIGDRKGEGISLNNIGLVYHELEEIEKALGYYNSSLTIRREIGDKGGEAATLNNIGKAYFESDLPGQALDYYNKSLELARAYGVRVGEAHILKNMGDVYQKQGDFNRAFDHYNQSLEIRRRLQDRPGEASVLDSLGTNLLSFGELQKAARMYGLALRLQRQIGNKTGEAETLYHIAQLKRVQGQLVEAREYIDSSVNILESLRVRMLNESLKASFLASSRSYYEFYIKLLFEMQETEPDADYAEVAFHLNERSRARGLMEQIAETSVDLTEGVDEELIREEQMLRESLTAQLDRQMKLLSGEHSKSEAERVDLLIEYLTNRYEQVESSIRRRSPRYAEMIRPQPLTMKQVQSEVLDDKTLLLSYAIGEEKSFVWAVWKNGYKTAELPGKEIVEHASLELYEQWSGETLHDLHGNEAPITQPTAPRAGARHAAWLSNILLQPVQDEIRNRRLIIVPDGALYFVPFGALPLPDESETRVTNKHELIHVPSASTLALLRKEKAARENATATIAVLADPVFDADDERLKSLAFQPGSGLEHASAKEDRYHLPRLPFTRREAKSILSLVPQGMSFEALDFRASRKTMFDPELRNYKYIHLATHGFMNTLNPDQSGVVLSLFDEKGNEQKGFVSAGEIFTLKLNADLVVLSACRTGLGKQIRGEGLLGLPRAFLYAGAERVAASLWKVDDIATAEFMRNFYEAMLGDKKLSPSQALRNAQIKMQNDPRWQSPYFWGAFVLQGDF